MRKNSIAKTFTGLITILKSISTSNATHQITLGADIPITANLTIPANIILDFDKYAFINTKDSIIVTINATVKADLVTIFSGFTPGQIIGNLGGVDRYPEWWGLKENRNELAINAAVQARDTLNSGHKVILQAKQYNVSGPIDLSSSNCGLYGKGASRTTLYTTSSWTADWKTDSLYGVDSHGAVVWLGSNVRDTIQSMNTSVEGLFINCYYASLANIAKRISGVSSYGWMEEHTIVRNITVSYYSGYGIGMCSNGSPTQVINGLLVENFWLNQPVSSSALPIAIGRHTTTATIAHGTIDCSVPPGGVLFNGNPWPLIEIGIYAEGLRAVFSDIHIESPKIGIMVRDYGQLNSIYLNSIDMKTAWETGMSTPVSTPTPSFTTELAPNTNYFDYSCLLAIYGEPSAYSPAGIMSGSAYNARTRVSATNLVGSENVRYLVRDPAMNQNILNWNNGQISESSGTITTYIRSNCWSPDNNAWYYNVPGCTYGVYPVEDKNYISIVG